MPEANALNADEQPIARSLASFVEAVGNLDRVLFTDRSLIETPWLRPWFRGQGSSEHALVPTGYRSAANEDELRNEFQRRAPALMEGEHPNDAWGWYFLMRHYGVPTRLLDWTEGSLIALHFALTSHLAGQAAVVWVLDPWWLNEISINAREIADPGETVAAPYLPAPFTKAPLPELPLAIQPHHVSRRIAVQRGYFTVHGSARDGFSVVTSRSSQKGLARIIVPEDAIPRIAVELDQAGITETSVFPDLEGLCRELVHDFVPGRRLPRPTA